MRLANWHRNVLLLVAALGFVWGVGELLARRFWDPGGYHTVVQAHPVYGWSLTPGAQLRSVDSDLRLRYDVAVNSWGWRDPERPRAKRRGSKRVLVLGDSMVYGTGVEQDERFGDVIDRELGQDVDVVHAAVAGWGTDQQYLYLTREGFGLDPDLVILGMCVANDVANNMLDHNMFGVAPKPRFELHDGELVYVPPAERPVPSWSHRAGRALQRSRLLHYVGRHVRILRARMRPRAPVSDEMPYLPADLENDESQWSVYQVDYGPRFEKAFRVTERLIEAMSDSCRARDVPFLVFAFPHKVEADAQARALELAHHGFAPHWFDMEKPHRRMQALATRRDFPYLYPIEDFRERQRREPLFFTRDSHPNAAGHALAARHLLPRVESALRLPIRPVQR